MISLSAFNIFKAAAFALYVFAASAVPAQAAHAENCADAYNYTLGVQPQEDGVWLSFKDFGSLPVAHVGGDKELMLSVRRIDSEFLQVDVGYIADGQLKSFFMKVAMDAAYPTRFARTFQPAPQLPVFAIELVPACSPT